MSQPTIRLYPGTGLENDFVLGTMICNIGSPIRKIVQVIKSKYPFWKFELYFSPTDPLDFDIIISIHDLGVKFIFDPVSQCLNSIDIYDITFADFVYQDQTFRSSKTTPTFTLIYKLFGPTHPVFACLPGNP
jgi:hypothetical protein